MTTIVVVRKGNQAAIAADSLTTFGSTRLERWIRWLFLANGVLAIPIFLTYFVNRSFMWVAALWSVTTTGSALLLVMFFRSASRQPATASAK